MAKGFTAACCIAFLVLLLVILEFGLWGALLSGVLARGHLVAPDTGSSFDVWIWFPLIATALAVITHIVNITSVLYRGKAYIAGLIACIFFELVNAVANFIAGAERGANLGLDPMDPTKLLTPQGCKELVGVVPEPNCLSWLEGLSAIHFILGIVALFALIICCCLGASRMNGNGNGDDIPLLEEETEAGGESKKKPSKLQRHAVPATTLLRSRTGKNIDYKHV